MAKYLYVATINCKKGNDNHGKSLEFEADEKIFGTTTEMYKLNQVALRLAKNQNLGEVVGYDKVEIHGYSQLRKIADSNSQTYKTNSTTSVRSSSKGLFSYHFLVIPFVLTYRILKFLGRIIVGTSKYLD